MGRKRKLARGRLGADRLAVVLAPDGQVSSPGSNVQRDTANLAPLSLDPHPDGSNPEWDIRQWLRTERQGPVGWGSIKTGPGVRAPAKQMRSEQDSNT